MQKYFFAQWDWNQGINFTRKAPSIKAGENLLSVRYYWSLVWSLVKPTGRKKPRCVYFLSRSFTWSPLHYLRRAVRLRKFYGSHDVHGHIIPSTQIAESSCLSTFLMHVAYTKKVHSPDFSLPHVRRKLLLFSSVVLHSLFDNRIISSFVWIIKPYKMFAFLNKTRSHEQASRNEMQESSFQFKFKH